MENLKNDNPEQDKSEKEHIAQGIIRKRKPV